jgi:hypothetical protein
MDSLKNDIENLIKRKKIKEKNDRLFSESYFNNFLEKIKFPSSFKIENIEKISENIKFPEQKEFPKSFDIKNYKDIAREISKEIKIPNKIEVSNFPEIKTEKIEIPNNLKILSFKNTETFLSNIYERIGKFALAFK